jgi:hypothetical protein
MIDDNGYYFIRLCHLAGKAVTGTWSHGPIRNDARSLEATAFPVRISNSKGRVVEKAEMSSGFCATSYRVGSLNG